MPDIHLAVDEYPLTATSTPHTSTSSLDNTPLTKPRPNQLAKAYSTHLNALCRDPSVLTTSRVVSIRTLLWWRLGAAFWTVFIIPWSLARGEAQTYLFYFTHLTWVGLGVWFLVSAFQTWRFKRDGSMNAFLKQSKFTQWVTWNLYVLPATFHWIVPIVYWALLSGSLIRTGKAIDWWTNVNVHALDFVFIMVEFYLNRVPMYYSQWPPVVGTGLAYLGYAFFQHGVYQGYDKADYPNGWWVYSFLNTSKASAWVYYLVLPLGFVGVFLFVVWLHKKRDRRREQ
ncbi:hypothetical protein SpCBS45565_g01843 [Spizellomyces sp. 'palustris']|nr:hypothetical protein SpCBS45565_g01843 [Spizellomyces sp. 'palustris']